ncbi:hypothetical protein TDB9533_03787 [Thalassocella blandensis]|nr:hypothetical protein TDB9533_03787 [Thalassocella blandensis]
MGQHSLNRPLVYRAIMKELSELCELRGPCSVIRYGGISGKTPGIIGEPAHINLSHMENLALKPLWYRYIKGDGNPIAGGILKRYAHSNYSVDFADGEELLEQVNYEKNPDIWNKLFKKLAKNSNIKGLGYLCLKLEPDVIWVVCLRKRNDEGIFTPRQIDLLHQFGHAAHGNQSSWYIPTFDLLDGKSKKMKDYLTERQYQTLYHLGNLCSRKECAKLMGVSVATVDRNVEALLDIFRGHFEKFDGKNIAYIIRSLKEEAFSHLI